MRKMYRFILGLIYIIVMSGVSYHSMPELTKEIFNNNTILLIAMRVLFNFLILIINIIIMSYIFRVCYKIFTKKTLTIKHSRTITFNMLLPLLYSHMLLLILISIIGLKSKLLIFLLINPLIYFFQINQLKENFKLKTKIFILIPFIIYSILDITTIYGKLI